MDRRKGEIKMKVTKEFGDYNFRRYGRPWAAKITAFDGRPTLDFIDGAWNGTADNGGEIIFDAQPGEVVKIGQADHRGSNTLNDFYRVAQDGKLEHIDSAPEARKAWEKFKAGDNKIVISISKLSDTLARDGWGEQEKEAIIAAVKVSGGIDAAE